MAFHFVYLKVTLPSISHYFTRKDVKIPLRYRNINPRDRRDFDNAGRKNIIQRRVKVRLIDPDIFQLHAVQYIGDESVLNYFNSHVPFSL